jgi:hypothetical protein
VAVKIDPARPTLSAQFIFTLCNVTYFETVKQIILEAISSPCPEGIPYYHEDAFSPCKRLLPCPP